RGVPTGDRPLWPVRFVRLVTRRVGRVFETHHGALAAPRWGSKTRPTLRLPLAPHSWYSPYPAGLTVPGHQATAQRRIPFGLHNRPLRPAATATGESLSAATASPVRWSRGSVSFGLFARIRPGGGYPMSLRYLIAALALAAVVGCSSRQTPPS